MIEQKNVINPAHYQGSDGKDAWTVMEEIGGPEAVIIFDLFNAVKYDRRKGLKEGNSLEQDQAKITNYFDHSEKMMLKLQDDIEYDPVKMWVAQVASRVFDYFEKQQCEVANTLGEECTMTIPCKDCDWN